jgi:hypothetical protein
MRLNWFFAATATHPAVGQGNDIAQAGIHQGTQTVLSVAVIAGTSQLIRGRGIDQDAVAQGIVFIPPLFLANLTHDEILLDFSSRYRSTMFSMR